ncbi:MAG: hypothetical protein COS40_04375, partial [Deltaproteobacteria bacterium CG03_land_8_20_14_0_80_45_14]
MTYSTQSTTFPLPAFSLYRVKTHIILALIVLKYISDAFEEQRSAVYTLPIHELKKGVKLGDTFGCCGP